MNPKGLPSLPDRGTWLAGLQGRQEDVTCIVSTCWPGFSCCAHQPVSFREGFTFCGLIWPHGDSLYGILPVPSQKLWTGQESRPQDTHGHLGSHSRSGQGPQIKSVTLWRAPASGRIAKLLLLCRLHLALRLPLKEGQEGARSQP